MDREGWRMKKLMRSILLLLVIALLTAVNSHAAVTGTVLGDDAKGLAGARIRVYPREASNDFYARMLSETPERAPLSTTETKSDGTFSADTKSASFVDVVVDAPGRHLIQLRSPDGEDIGALILNTAPMRTGHVTANGKPVAGARIACGRALVVKSDDKGEFQVPELSAFERIVVIHPEYAITERGASEPSIDFALVTGSQIRGRVSGTDGQAVPHATITVNGWPLAQSRHDGSFLRAHAPEKWPVVTPLPRVPP